MARTSKARVIGFALVAFASLVASASADDGDAAAKANAAARLDEGLAHFNAGRHQAALDSFQQAYAAFPSPKIHLNIAAALRALGREADAANRYDRFLVEASALPDLGERMQLATQALAELDPRLGRLMLETEIAALTVAIDDVNVELRPGRPIYVVPGGHHVVARAEGLIPREFDIHLAAGQVDQRRLVLTPIPAPDRVVIKPASPLAEPIESSPRRFWSWVAAGSAGALLAGGVVFSLRAQAAFDDYVTTNDPDEFDRLRGRIAREDTIANVLFAGAGAAALATVIVYWWGERDPRATRTVGVVPLTGGAGVVAWVPF